MKEIQLTQGKVAFVDDEDYNKVSHLFWYVQFSRKTAYARAYNPETKKQVRMHRIIMGITDPSITIDHKNGDGLDNQRDNLRAATIQQNAMNMRKHKGSSIYKGVSFSYGKWSAQIRIGKKMLTLGRFTDQKEAALAYNEAAIKHYGEFARLNTI